MEEKARVLYECQDLCRPPGRLLLQRSFSVCVSCNEYFEWMAFWFGFSVPTMSSTECLIHTVYVLTIFQGIKCYCFITQIISGMPRPRWLNFNTFEYSVKDSDLIIIKEIKNMKITRARFLYSSFYYCERLVFFCSRRRLFICNIWFFPILLFN